MAPPARLSVPVHRRQPPRPLADDERAALLRIADTLIPGTAADPPPGRSEGYEAALDRALAARDDAFAAILTFAAEVAAVPDEALEAELRRRSTEDPLRFQAASAVLAGAYLLLPDVRQRIGYPGQERRRAPFDQFAGEIADGILDPVVARGPIYTPAPG